LLPQVLAAVIIGVVAVVAVVLGHHQLFLTRALALL
jgi:hypothetical protein